jgi:hypothetical protein
MIANDDDDGIYFFAVVVVSKLSLTVSTEACRGCRLIVEWSVSGMRP